MFSKGKNHPGGMLFWDEGGWEKVKTDYCSIFLVPVKLKGKNKNKNKATV